MQTFCSSLGQHWTTSFWFGLPHSCCQVRIVGCWREKGKYTKKKKKCNENVSNTANTRYIGIYTHRLSAATTKRTWKIEKCEKAAPAARKKRKKTEENCVSQGKSKQHLKNITSICI